MKAIVIGETFRDILHRVMLLAVGLGTGAIPLPEEVFDGEVGLIKALATIIGMVLGLFLTSTSVGVARSRVPERTLRFIRGE